MKNILPSTSAFARYLCILSLLTSFSPVRGEATKHLKPISLAGTWRFQLDPADQGEASGWQERDLKDKLKLPGSLQEQGFGEEITVETKWTGGTGDRKYFTDPRFAPYREPGNVKVPFWLQPEKHYVGAAWYQREITIPEGWSGKRIVLVLERPHWGTTVWLDSKKLGSQDALGVPHEYELGQDVQAGQHKLTIRVDNRLIIPVGQDAHSVTDHTQGNWNGLVGDIQLRATERVWIENVQVYPDATQRKARVSVTLKGAAPGSGTLEARVEAYNTKRRGSWPAVTVPAGWSGGDGVTTEFEVQLGKDAEPWDEFNPALYRLSVQVPGVTTPRETTFGLREVSVQGKQIAVNGRKIFLRGTLECCIFPLHGYPPTDVQEWKRVLRIARAHGLNHLRFHSWCPPEAAFVAADEMGFYYQVECSAWAHNFNRGTSLDQWIYAESERMIKARGNHPSFLLMVPSNEPGGPQYEGFLAKFVEHWKAKDSRRLYTAGSGWPRTAENQYHVTYESRGFPVQAKLGETAGDYSAFLEKQTAPIVSHEIGQYCVFPNLDEIKKYKGLLKPKNFEIVRDFLAEAGLSGQARDFLEASGKLQALFYKDEIEACLRTRGWAGFQLLDVHDFPGQGTALVGVLDPFWEEKGYITPSEYRRFCDETVPLARLPKRIWTSDETFWAEVDIAHFGPQALEGASAKWTIRTQDGHKLASGTLAPGRIEEGTVSRLGAIEFPLAQLSTAAALNLDVSIPGTRFGNDWNFWVYPAQAAEPATEVIVTHTLGPEVMQRLEAGEGVLLLAEPRMVAGRTVGRFDPIFWNRLWFPTQPQHTLGLWVEKKHPALKLFPTAEHSDWEWQDLQNRAKPMILSQLPAGVKPIVQVIDDWNTCRKLGLLFEAKVGKGRLLVCSIDLDSDLANRPTARQLRASLMSYVSSKRFQPEQAVDAVAIQGLFRELSLAEKLGARVVRCNSEESGYEASHVLDGLPETMWHTQWGEGAPGFPHEFVLGFDKAATLTALRILPRQDQNQNGWIKEYAVFASEDGERWGEPVSKGQFARDAAEKEIRFGKAITARFLKFVALSGFDRQPFASLAEISLVGDGRESLGGASGQ